MYWLRPILLLAGTLFIAILFWWDRRRTRQAASTPPARATRTEPSFESTPSATPATAPGSDREQRRALPVIDWSAQESVVRDTPHDEPTFSPDLAPVVAPMPAPMPAPDSVPTAASVSAAVSVPPALPDTPPPMIVEWPAENARRIVTLRIVPAGTDRLPGRALRQALTGCGFRHGEFGIFHLPDDVGRVILSAASLVQPGTLDPTGMDFQRFPGLNVFAVLPGPQSAERTLERLGQLALELSARVSGRVHDDQSATLTAGTVSAWRKRMLSTLGDVGDSAAAAAASSAGPASSASMDNDASASVAGPAD